MEKSSPAKLTQFAGNSALQKFPQQSKNFIFMARVELVIGVVDFISDGFILKTAPFRVLGFFQKKTYSERHMKKCS